MAESNFVEGTILSGPKAGYRIRVEDDWENTGGFLIVFSPADGRAGGGDQWVERFEYIQDGLDQVGWEIDWDQPLESLRSQEKKRRRKGDSHQI